MAAQPSDFVMLDWFSSDVLLIAVVAGGLSALGVFAVYKIVKW